MRKLWASATAPVSPGIDEVYLDISTTPCLIKRYNGATWEVIGNVGIVTGVSGTAPIASSGGAAPAISLNNAGVTYAKIQNVSAADKILGRVTAGAGSVEEIACTAAGRALLDDANAAAQLVTLGLGTSENTWTIGVSFGNGTTGITYSKNTGYYTKIGNMVFCSGYLVLSSKGSSTGAARITGLPFTVANNEAAYSAVTLGMWNVTFANQFQGWVGYNTTTIILYEVTEAGTLSSLTDADFSNTASIVIGAIYRAT